MAYANSRAITIDKTKVPSNQVNFPFLFTTLCDTLTSNINNSATSFAVVNGVQIANGDLILIDSEKMLVSAGGGTTSLTVVRAQLGTSAASHLAGAVITNLFLASVAEGGGVTNASGFDIIFATDAVGASPVAYERVLWTSTQGMIEAHVISQPTSATNYVMYVLWGNAAVTTDQSNPTAVWDANFQLIAHVPDGTTLSLADSTTHNIGTNSGATAGVGEIDGAVHFDAVSQFINYGAGSDLNITGDITMECWINPSTTSINVIIARMNGLTQTNGYQFYLNGNSIVCEYRNASATPDFITTNNAITGNVWSHVACKRTSGTMKVLVNGVDPGIFASRNQGTSTTGSVTDTFFVGKNAGGFFWGGTIDEMRMSNIARSDNWLITGFNSQGSPNTFYLLGANTPINPSSRVTQAIVEIMILQNPAVRVTQAVVEIMVLAFVPPPPVPGQGVAIVGGNGAKQRSKGGCNPKVTHYDWCLEHEGALMRKIKFPPSCSIPKEYCNLLPWDDAYGATPEQSFPFLKQAGILTPTTVSGDNVVVSFRVTSGYDGLLSGFYFQYSGAGFSQGSGDIIWRIKINQRYVKDLSNVAFLLGDPVNPIPMTQGQIITPGQTIQAIVNIPNLSGMIQIGNSTVYAGLLGFFWPR